MRTLIGYGFLVIASTALSIILISFYAIIWTAPEVPDVVVRWLFTGILTFVLSLLTSSALGTFD